VVLGITPDDSFLAHLPGPSLVVGIGEGLVWVASMIGATSGTSAA
jgi:hypothetical protein